MIIALVIVALCILGIIYILVKAFENGFGDEDNNHWTGIR